MWYAKYKEIAINGLRPELKVTVFFYNDTNNEVYESVYEVLAVDLKSGSFSVQEKLDILNTKDTIIAESKTLIGESVSTKIP